MAALANGLPIPTRAGRRSDERLVAAVRLGDETAFAEIHDRHRPALERYARRILDGRSAAGAEDVVQEVFVKAHAALRADDRDMALRAWLYRLVRNRCLDELRRPASRETVPIDEAMDADAGLHADPLEATSRRQELRDVVSDLAALPDRQRAVLLGREVEGLSHEEVAAQLGITVRASKNLANRARENLVRSAHARNASCETVRGDLLGAHERRRRASPHALRHVAGCRDCRRYRRELADLRAAMRILSPGPLLVPLAGAVTSWGALGGLSAGAGATGVKLAASAAVTAAAAGGAFELAQTSTFAGGAAPMAIRSGVLAGPLRPGDRVPAGTSVLTRKVTLAPGTATHPEITMTWPARQPRRRPDARPRHAPGLRLRAEHDRRIVAGGAHRLRAAAAGPGDRRGRRHALQAPGRRRVAARGAGAGGLEARPPDLRAPRLPLRDARALRGRHGLPLPAGHGARPGPAQALVAHLDRRGRARLGADIGALPLASRSVEPSLDRPPMAWSAPLALRGAGGEPVDLRRCVRSHGLTSLPPFHRHADDRGFDVVARVGADGPLRLRVREDGPGLAQVSSTVVPSDGDAAVGVAAHLLRLDDDLSGFYAAIAGDPDLAWAAAGAGRLMRAQTVFEEVVKTICTTNCAWSATERMVGALVRELGEPAAGDPADGAWRAFPTPAAMAEADEPFYATVVRAGYRGRALHQLAEHVASGALDLEGLARVPREELSDDELEELLLGLRGVGPYAAAHVMLLLGRYSRLVLDSWTRPTWARLHGRKVQDPAIVRRFARYGEYAGLAFWLRLTRDWVDEAGAGAAQALS